MIKDDPKYVTYVGTDCFSASVINYLKYKGIEVDSGIVCAMNDGFCQAYTDEEATPFAYGGVLTALYNFIIENNGKVTEEEYASDEVSPVEFLKNCVDENKMVVISVITDGFDYDDVFKQSRNWSHYVNIVGYEGDDFIISDGYVPTMVPKRYDGKLSMAKAVEAWEKKKFYYIIFDLDEFNRTNFANADILRKNLKEQLIKFVDAGKTSKVDGFSAFDRLLEAIESLYTREDFEAISMKINHDLKVFGFFSMRSSLNTLLKEIDSENEVFKKYDPILQRYQIFCVLLLKLGMSRKSSDLERLLRFAKGVQDSEKEFFEELIEIL